MNGNVSNRDQIQIQKNNPMFHSSEKDSRFQNDEHGKINKSGDQDCFLCHVNFSSHNHPLPLESSTDTQVSTQNLHERWICPRCFSVFHDRCLRLSIPHSTRHSSSSVASVLSHLSPSPTPPHPSSFHTRSTAATKTKKKETINDKKRTSRHRYAEKSNSPFLKNSQNSIRKRDFTNKHLSMRDAPDIALCPRCIGFDGSTRLKRVNGTENSRRKTQSLSNGNEDRNSNVEYSKQSSPDTVRYSNSFVENRNEKYSNHNSNNIRNTFNDNNNNNTNQYLSNNIEGDEMDREASNELFLQNNDHQVLNSDSGKKMKGIPSFMSYFGTSSSSSLIDLIDDIDYNNEEKKDEKMDRSTEKKQKEMKNSSNAWNEGSPQYGLSHQYLHSKPIFYQEPRLLSSIPRETIDGNIDKDHDRFGFHLYSNPYRSVISSFEDYENLFDKKDVDQYVDWENRCRGCGFENFRNNYSKIDQDQNNENNNNLSGYCNCNCSCNCYNYAHIDYYNYLNNLYYYYYYYYYYYRSNNYNFSRDHYYHLDHFHKNQIDNSKLEHTTSPLGSISPLPHHGRESWSPETKNPIRSRTENSSNSLNISPHHSMDLDSSDNLNRGDGGDGNEDDQFQGLYHLCAAAVEQWNEREKSKSKLKSKRMKMKKKYSKSLKNKTYIELN